jgi:hypothetical protein
MLEPNEREKYGKNARRYAEQHHNIETIVEKYKTVFLSLVSPAR